MSNTPDKTPRDWTVTPDETEYTGGDVHAIPNNDLRDHVQEIYCSCKPKISDETFNGRVVLHRAYDEREVVEEIFDHE